MARTVLLGDVIKLQRGYDLPANSRLVGSYPIVSSSGITGFHNTPKVKGPGVITGRYGTLGKSFYVEGDYWPLNTTLYVKDFKGNNPKYVAYLLSELKLGAENIAGAVPGINRNFLHKIKVSYIDPTEQAKVVDIIDSIDEKIELNRKMNETLEQMGQALFSHHFITNPAAKEWGLIAIGKKIHPKRGKSLQSRDMITGPVPVISGGLQPAGFHNESNTTSPAITVSASGANAGFVAIWEAPVWSADSCFIDTTITEDVYFYYLFMKARQEVIYGMQTGSGQPHIYPKHIELLEIPDAPADIMVNFREMIEPLFKKIDANKAQMQTLTTLRDTLLPQLINGKVAL